jgi:hypothetical protein
VKIPGVSEDESTPFVPKSVTAAAQAGEARAPLEKRKAAGIMAILA